MALNSPKIIDIVKIEDYRGNLSVLQHPSPLPFVPARAYWIHDVPSGMMREGHAYNCSQELIIPSKKILFALLIFLDIQASILHASTLWKLVTYIAAKFKNWDF